MSYTRGQFATDVLHAIGNNNPTPQTVDWVVAWSLAETGHPSGSYQGASYNLLNTTQPASGATDFNSIGVKNYTSYSQGVNATAQTLENGYYTDLLAALRTNDDAALGFGSNSPTLGILHNLNTWCGSCGYGNEFVHNAGMFVDEVFSGLRQAVAGSPSPSPTPQPSPAPSGPDPLAIARQALATAQQGLTLAKQATTITSEIPQSVTNAKTLVLRFFVGMVGISFIVIGGLIAGGQQ